MYITVIYAQQQQQHEQTEAELQLCVVLTVITLLSRLTVTCRAAHIDLGHTSTRIPVDHMDNVQFQPTSEEFGCP